MMNGEIHVRRRPCSEGTAFYLDYSYSGVRYRPRLGVNVSKEQQTQLALEMVKRIHGGGSTKALPQSGCTFNQFLPTFWQAFHAKGRVDAVRPEGIIHNHLQPRFGTKLLAEINDPVVGMEYVTARMRAGATAGTIQREWNVWMRVMNLAVDFDKLDKNRLKRVPRPEPAKRERSVERWELEALRDKGGDSDVWRAAIVAMHTGLREGKILSIAGSAIRRLDDGHWLYLVPARTTIKGNPELLPLNAHALRAASSNIEKTFRWQTAHAFKQAWARACDRAGIVDLHFHDLRHLFATTLDELGVKDRYISLLLGHKVQGMTGRYIRKNLRHLRDAVTRLEVVFDPCNLSVGDTKLSPDLSPKQVSYSTSPQVLEKQR